MAIGKLNAYATVDAPKADFGAVAQLNIDNLVKSAKEDEQLKVAKKAAEDKAKAERAKEFGDFVTFDASGVSLQDQYSNKEAMDLLPKWLENKRLYEETKDPKYFTEGQRILGYVNGINKNTKVLKESVDRFAIAAGKDEIASKWSKAGIDKIKSLKDGNTVFGRGADGNGEVATYETLPDGSKKIKGTEKYPDYLSIISNAPNAVDFTDELQKDKNLFERNLTETQVNVLRKEGTKAISGATEIAIGKLAKSKMNDDKFLAVYLSEIGETTDDDLRTSGFKDTEKAKAIEAYKKQLISLYGVDKTVDVKQAPTPSKDGGGKAIKGQATVAVDNPYKLIKVGEVQGYNNGKNENVTTVPVNSLSFPINPSGMDKPELLDSSIGGKNGFTITPKSFYVSPDGDLLLHATAKAGEKIAGEGYSESTTTSGEEYVFSYKTNGTEFANALRGFLNTQPDLEINGRVRQIRTAKDVFNYFDELEKSRGGKGLKTKTVSTGASNKTKSSNTNNKKVIKGF